MIELFGFQLALLEWNLLPPKYGPPIDEVVVANYFVSRPPAKPTLIYESFILASKKSIESLGLGECLILFYG